mmetsp:Transcript_18287/g.45505  ORF Transcript_18287/g.45505 Transcript_18287/m.45505 type:complete len:542 (-) Transcript_18287:399-2024(-)
MESSPKLYKMERMETRASKRRRDAAPAPSPFSSPFPSAGEEPLPPSSPSLDLLRESFSDIFKTEILSRLDTLTLTLLARVSHGFSDAVQNSAPSHRAAWTNEGDPPRNPLYETVFPDLRDTLDGTVSRAGPPLAVKAFCDSVAMLNYALDQGCPKRHWLCTNAAEEGHLEVLQAARTRDCPWNSLTTKKAAAGGHLEVLKWLRENGCENTKATCTAAAAGGHLEVLKWCRAKWKRHREVIPWGPEVCSAAAGNGQLETLKWAFENGCPWDAETCAKAAKIGRLDILQYVRQRDCPWDGEASTGAAFHGHLEVLTWIQENGGVMDTGVAESVPFYAAVGGHLEVLKFAHAINLPWDSQTYCAMAASGADMPMLTWLHGNHGNEWNEMTPALAAQGGHLDVLKWVIARGCPWGYQVWKGAALEGHLHILEYAAADHCPGRDAAPAAAAEAGRVDVLRWLHQRGVPLDQRTCINAAKGGHLEALMWAREQGCPWNTLVLLNARKYKHFLVAEWAKANGCPEPTREDEALAKADGTHPEWFLDLQ